MEWINKGKAMLGGNKSHSTTNTGAGAGGAGQKDVLDKAVNSVQAKFGIDKTGKYDKYEEKGTDFLRGQGEKSTGKKVPSKFSN